MLRPVEQGKRGGVRVFYGVDVGQEGDPAAEAVIAPAGKRPGGGDRPVWRLVGAGTVPKGSYGALADHVAARRRSLAEQTDRSVLTAVDATGCGRPVVEMIRDRAGAVSADTAVLGVTFTAGRRIGGVWPDITVPKRVLVEHVQVALEHGGLVVDRDRPGAAELVAEMRRFTDAGGKFGASPGAHDDLVCALMLAVWMGDTVAERIAAREGVAHE